MKNEEFPHCCTAKVLCDFGESGAAEGGDREQTVFDVLQSFKEEVIDNIYDHGLAMYVAITNNEQKSANKVFRMLGFKHTKWMRKTAHRDTKIRMWWIHVDDIPKRSVVNALIKEHYQRT